VIMAVVLGSPARADLLFDGFEDGNWTSNPTWFEVNQGYGQNGGIVADPVRPNNHVWKVMGSEAAGRYLATSDFAPMPWTGFRSSVEFLTTTSRRFEGIINIRDGIVGGEEEVIGVGLWHDATWGNQVNLCMAESNPSEPTWVSQNNWFDLSLVPINEWLRISLWHDPMSGLIKSDVRKVSDNSLIVEASLTPVTFGGSSPLTYMWIGCEELEWQYMDNATLDGQRPGDLNCDGVVDFGDINPFVLYLSQYGVWQNTYPDCDPRVGDINGDGTYPSFGDINPFVALLTSGG
jgi:hypothetical protein